MTSPDPVATKWVPIWNGGSGAGPQIPPVVNGQWLKGQGGVPVWSAISDADVPAVASGRLAPTANTNFTDWNACTTNGWYTSPNAANAPGGNAAWGAPGWLLGWVVCHNTSWPTQEVWAFTEYPARRWRRTCQNGGWQPWQLLDAPWANINNFSGYGGGCGDYDTSHWGPGRICKRAGVVYCEGLISIGGGAGTGVFTLPVDCRPGAGKGIIFNTANGAGTYPETWRVDSSGQVTVSLGPANWVTLSGVTFYAEG
jgi:hypothetical protein